DADEEDKQDQDTDGDRHDLRRNAQQLRWHDKRKGDYLAKEPKGCTGRRPRALGRPIPGVWLPITGLLRVPGGLAVPRRGIRGVLARLDRILRLLGIALLRSVAGRGIACLRRGQLVAAVGAGLGPRLIPGDAAVRTGRRLVGLHSGAAALPMQLAGRWNLSEGTLEELAQFLRVADGIVRVAIVEDRVHLGGALRHVLELGRPALELARLVEVAKLLRGADALLLPVLRVVAMKPHHAERRRRSDHRRHARREPLRL